jgi:hypothetical protein
MTWTNRVIFPGSLDLLCEQRFYGYLVVSGISTSVARSESSKALFLIKLCSMLVASTAHRLCYEESGCHKESGCWEENP